MAITTRTNATLRDNHSKSYVNSPARGDDWSAQEVVVSNTSNEPIPVDPTTRGEAKTEYNEVSSVGSDILTIINLTVGVGVGYDISRASCSGDNVAIFTVEVNNNVIDKKRITWNDWNTKFEFNELGLSEGDNIKIKVENVKSYAADFNATLYYSEYNI